MTISVSSSSEQHPIFMSQFTGKERDAETGLDYFGARYYSGAQGRFMREGSDQDKELAGEKIG
jgi:RHS repeat-associated protein